MVTAVVRVTLRDDIDLEEFGKLEEKMMALGSSMPGFQEIKEFNADDGESIMLVTFETRADMIRWRDHPKHKKAQQRGREHYFSRYDVKICDVVHHYSFSDGKRTQHEIQGSNSRAPGGCTESRRHTGASRRAPAAKAERPWA